MDYRLNEVREVLAGWFHAIDPLLVNEMDQRALFWGDVSTPPGTFERVHGVGLGDPMWGHWTHYGVPRAMVRAHTPRITSVTTGLLVRPSWPMIMTKSEARANSMRLAAFVESSDDWCTDNALQIRRNVAGLARLRYIAETPGMVGRLVDYVPRPYHAHEMEHLLQLMDICALYGFVENRRARVERRLIFMRHEYAGEWFNLTKERDFFERAASDTFALWQYFRHVVPAFERRLGIANDVEDDELEDEEEEEEEEADPAPWPTLKPCPPSMMDHDASEDTPGDVVCGICYDCDDECEKADFSCGHAFSVSCAAKWFDTCTANGNPRTCPTCRVIPVNADYFGCHGCGRTSYQTEQDPNGLQLYTLGGPCHCDAVWCMSCAPSRDVSCPNCLSYYCDE